MTQTGTASQKVFNTDLNRINARLQALGAVVTLEDDFTYVDESKVPASLATAYRHLIQYGYANGLI